MAIPDCFLLCRCYLNDPENRQLFLVDHLVEPERPELQVVKPVKSIGRDRQPLDHRAHSHRLARVRPGDLDLAHDELFQLRRVAISTFSNVLGPPLNELRIWQLVLEHLLRMVAATSAALAPLTVPLLATSQA